MLFASQNINNKGAILVPKDDTYLTHQNCNSRSIDEVIINLSDDVQIDTIHVSNHEDFSAQHGLIEFYGSIEYPPPNDKWINLGSLSPEESELQGLKENYILSLSELEQSSMVRYLKVVMHGPQSNLNGLYCTLTSVKVYGSSMHQVMRNSLMDLVVTSQPEDEALSSGS